MREGILHHKWCESNEEFFTRIDKFGGWPLGKKYIQFYHGDDRDCKFSNEYVRDGWWTTVASSDDYYRWKLSPEAISKIKSEAKEELIRELQRFPKF
jgi:hypothetical protein